MIQLVEQTREEKFKMYSKLTKKQIIEMLINCNDIIDSMAMNATKNIYEITAKTIAQEMDKQRLLLIDINDCLNESRDILNRRL